MMPTSSAFGCLRHAAAGFARPMRKVAGLCVGGAALLATVAAAHAGAAFEAYMFTNARPLFVIRIDAATSDWLPLAGEFHGYRVASFDPTTEILTVGHAGASESLPLKSGKVAPAPADPNEPLRTLHGMELAYEVARRGDQNTRQLLIRYQDTLTMSHPHDPETKERALRYLREEIDRLARNAAERMLRESK